jgi:GNAT superfamily N-acetyltransferase
VDERPTVTVRPAREDDDLDAMNVGNPAWMGAAMMRELFASSGDVPSGALIAEIDGEAAGYGDFAAIGVLDGHRAPATVYVVPSQRRRRVGQALWAAVLERCTSDRVRGVMLASDADDGQSRDIALAHGLRLGGLHIESELDLTALDEASMERRAVAPVGLTLFPLAADTDEQTWRAFAELHERLAEDTPDRAAGSEPMSYEIVRAFLAEPWQVMGAWDGSEIVGFTAVSVRDASAGARVLNTHLTGVLPAYRSRGIATALKAAHAIELSRAGWRTIRTQNMDGNVPILAANQTLGFVRARALQDLTYDHPTTH